MSPAAGLAGGHVADVAHVVIVGMPTRPEPGGPVSAVGWPPSAPSAPVSAGSAVRARGAGKARRTDQAGFATGTHGVRGVG